MEIYTTEEQQVEAIKKFWKDNGTAIILGAVIGLGGLWGWRYYNEQRIAGMDQASGQYQQVMQGLESDDQGFSKALDYVNTHSDNNYALLTAMQLANKAVTRDDLSEAAKQLKFAAEKSSVPAITAIANLRLARVHVQLEQYPEALAVLDAIGADNYQGQVQELRGDVFVKQGNLDKARAAYSAAMEIHSGNNLIKMKLDNLPAVASV
ncbi:YfgM family protein [Bowmanella yangjiangensis]|uniref:Ancillary SecYEG translocon subunit n=1 Tax=Bowmanella yangjiangensis TaxID=2811230 RepID=A0ABS3CT27_9ALTE|nr:tetratricopeptide repeat protein [Bowmanella yangjiangensis]MBN7818799.1 tetratricopeptide repeat protein [Bowmanella yangjiangensis]